MRRYVNNCVGCPPERGCLGSACPKRRVLEISCDECGDDGEIFDYDGQELCRDCLISALLEDGIITQISFID